MRVAILGDSNIGQSADDRGGLAQALRPYLAARGASEFYIAGVSSSTAGQWVVRRDSFTQGAPRDLSKGRGVFRPFRNLTPRQGARTDLETVKRFRPDMLVLNFGSNDSAGYGGGNPRAFVENILWLREYIGVPVILLDGGYATGTERKKRSMMQVAGPMLRAQGVTVVSADTPTRRAPFEAAGARSHPRARVWTQFLELQSVQQQFRNPLRPSSLGLGWAYGVILLGALFIASRF